VHVLVNESVNGILKPVHVYGLVYVHGRHYCRKKIIPRVASAMRELIRAKATRQR